MKQQSNRADHMANERTFLSWIRTSIGIMAFGFVVEKFALFIQQIALFLSAKGLPETHPTQGYSSVFGILLVALGALMGLFAFISYRKTEREIEENKYYSTATLPTVLTVLVVGMGIFLVVYLLSR